MSQGEMAEVNALHIINTNFDINNVVPIKETRERIQKTLDSCASILRDHCGPRSGYAMLLDDNDVDLSFRPSQFTKDGISIMKAIRYVAPLERYVKNILTYIGDRVDQVAKDGTTTSMLLAAILLGNLLRDKDEIFPKGLSTYQINNIVNSYFSSVLEQFKSVTVHFDDLLPPDANEQEICKIAGQIAYLQALSSSGGDHELAYAMQRIFESSPRETWEFMDYYQSGRETKERYAVEIDEFDAKIRCINGCSVPMNEGLGTEYKEDDVTIVLFPGPMMQSDFISGEVMAYLEKTDPNKPYLILATMVDGMFTSRITALNNTRSKPITIWQFSPIDQIAGQVYPWELMVLAAKCGITPAVYDRDFKGVDPKKHLFTANVHWKDTYMHFYNCIFRDDEETVLHPFYIHPEKATDFYKQSIEKVKEQIEEYKTGHRPDGRMYSHFMQVLNDLACIKRPKLRIGGTSHDNLTSKPIVQDVQGAIMSTLSHGFVVNGIGSLITALHKVNNACSHTEDMASTFQRKFASVLTDAAHTVFIDINEKIYDLSSFSQKYNYYNHLYGSISDFENYLWMMKVRSSDEETSTYLAQGYPIIQPAMVTIELIKRIQELVLKVVLTDKAIVFGGVMIKDEDKGEETCQ